MKDNTGEGTNPPVNPGAGDPGKVEGRIVLPAGSPYNTGTLKVVSPKEELTLRNDSFKVDTTFNNYFTTMVVTGTDNVVMMGYHYPGQQNFDITPRSTALALVMNTGAVMALDNTLRNKFIQEILVANDFKLLTNEIEKSIKAGANYLAPDSGSTVVTTAARLFGRVSNAREGVFEKPVEMKVIGTSISFVANTACPYVIGVYKDNATEQLAQLTLDGAQVFPTSLKELFEGVFGAGYGDVPVQTFSMDKDGSYQFRIRSGNPASGGIQKEVMEAFRENMKKAVLNMCMSYLGIATNSECYKDVQSQLLDWSKTFRELPKTVNSFGDMCAIVHDISIEFFKTTQSLEKCLSPEELGIKKKYLAYIAKAVKFLDFVGKVGVTMNASAQVVSWYKSNPAIDTCLTVNGKTVGSCALNLTISRTDKQVSAHVTGGVPPYTFRYANTEAGTGWTSNFVPGSSFNIRYNGTYGMIVKDATGQLDTALDCINDLTIRSITGKSGNNAVGEVAVNYTSSLGLLPYVNDGVWAMPDNTYKLSWYVINSNHSEAGLWGSLDKYCSDVSYGSVAFASTNVTGNDFNRTLTFKIPSSQNGPVNITFRLKQSCSGWTCNGKIPAFFSEPYTISWGE